MRLLSNIGSISLIKTKDLKEICVVFLFYVYAHAVVTFGCNSSEFCCFGSICKPKKSDIVKHDLRVTSYELRVEILKAQVESLKARVKIQNCEIKSTSSVIN